MSMYLSINKHYASGIVLALALILFLADKNMPAISDGGMNCES